MYLFDLLIDIADSFNNLNFLLKQTKKITISISTKFNYPIDIIILFFYTFVMNNTGAASTSNAKIASVRKYPVFKKCQCLVSRYALSLGRIQEKIYEEYGQTEEQRKFFDDGFYNTNNLLTQHLHFCMSFARCHERCEMPRIEELIDAWKLLIKTLKTPQYHHITNEPESMRACQNLMKFIIGFCLLENKCYEALHCLWVLLRFTRFEDTNCWMLCLLWALRLEEWELLGHFLKQEKNTTRKWPVSEGYIACIACIQIAHRLGTANEGEQQYKAVDEVTEKLKWISTNAKPTFLYSQAKTVLRRAIIISSRIPNADLAKIDDPFYHRELEMSSCVNVMRSYHPEFFLSSKASSIQSKMQSADEFMRYCSAYADYMETAIAYCWDFWDSGMVREAEGVCFSLWRNNMAFGNAHWTLRFLSLLFYFKSSTTFELDLLDNFADCLRALLTPQTASTSYYLNTPKRNIRPSVFRRGSAVDDSFETDLNGNEQIKRNDLDNILAMEMSSMNLLPDSDEQKKQFCLEKHVFDCECSFCVGKASNWAIALELEWVTLTFQRFSLQQFECFQKALKEMDTEKIQPLRQKLILEVIGHDKPSTKLPPLFVHYSARAVCCLFLENSNKISAALLNPHVKMAIHPCEHSSSPLYQRANWLLLRIFKQKEFVQKKKATEDYTKYGHLFLREWRFRCCSFLARYYLRTKDFWSAAFYQIEAMVPSIRQTARLNLRKKAELSQKVSEVVDVPFESIPSQSSSLLTENNAQNNFAQFAFKDSIQLKRCIDHLPLEMTFVNIFIDDEGVLWLTRCHALHGPIVVKLCEIRKNAQFLLHFNILLEASNESVKKSMRPLDIEDQHSRELNEKERAELERREEIKRAKIFWDERKQLDKEIEQFCEDLQSNWFGSAAPLLLPYTRDSNTAEKRFTLLAVSPPLSQLPWENLPIFKRSPYVMRIPSLHIFEHLICQHQSIPRTVDGQNSFYLLNPGGDLMNTQKRMEEFISKFEWRGLAGTAPSRDQIRHALTQYDLFLYIGHGSGGRYFGRSIMRENDCRAVSILMGCSSVRITDEGFGFDGRATLYDYLIARCPCIVGCLWLVTDGEIDRFFMALMEYCFTTKNDAGEKQPSNSLKLIAEGMALARSRCKLPYLTGASVVSYGLPVVSMMNSIKQIER